MKSLSALCAFRSGSCTRLIFAVLCIFACVSTRATPQDGLQVLLQQAEAAETNENYPQAERLYRRALTIAPNDLQTLKHLGLLYQKELKFDESLRVFQRVLNAAPQFFEVNLFEGISYLAKQDFSHAIESIQHELGTPEPHPRSHYYLALALGSSGRTDEAVAELNRSLQDHPADLDALYQLIRLHNDEAEAELEQAARSNAEEAGRLTELAHQHDELARKKMEQLRQAGPDSFQYHSLMGEGYSEAQRPTEALREYRAALSKRPNALGLHYNIGASLWAKGLYDEAALEFQKALRENPKDPRTNLYLAGIAVRQQRFQEALGFLSIAQTQSGLHTTTKPLLHLLLGKCYLELKDFEKAKAELLLTVKANPEDSEAHYLLARVYRKLGDEQARARELELFQKLSKGKTKAEGVVSSIP
jgi:tetratricopeptide (TPR) repeat protein